MPVKPDSKEVVSSIADPSYVMAAQELIAGQCPGESDVIINLYVILVYKKLAKWIKILIVI
ncbi:hypothetical protein RirG_000380 [Rhizophagus irregularis DAOM 197198w]|uniref:Uncharacterized protein n=1 Tax=Rhizophagus irregularis (strain DAOM 197198w) TaxID=1432141 RepID=A0A015JJZ8_RHIIW|nr:hypothetical protein RirG_092880 [Rhizophagus irregularis DAOM 197198w]EXX79980.1 hypothetical protein RirG_000380 [Rhizophagus irregularis DAOM 197198w]